MPLGLAALRARVENALAAQGVRVQRGRLLQEAAGRGGTHVVPQDPVALSSRVQRDFLQEDASSAALSGIPATHDCGALPAQAQPGRVQQDALSAAVGGITARPHDHVAPLSGAHGDWSRTELTAPKGLRGFWGVMVCVLCWVGCGDERAPWSGFPLFPPDAGGFELSPEVASGLLAAQAAFARELAGGALDAGVVSSSATNPNGPARNMAGAAAPRPSRPSAPEDDGKAGRASPPIAAPSEAPRSDANAGAPSMSAGTPSSDAGASDSGSRAPIAAADAGVTSIDAGADAAAANAGAEAPQPSDVPAMTTTDAGVPATQDASEPSAPIDAGSPITDADSGM